MHCFEIAPCLEHTYPPAGGLLCLRSLIGRDRFLAGACERDWREHEEFYSNKISAPREECYPVLESEDRKNHYIGVPLLSFIVSLI